MHITMDKQAVKVLLVMLVFASLIFCADVMVTGGSFSSFYVCVILISLWSDDDRLLIGAFTGSIILIFTSYISSFTFESFDWHTLTSKLVSFVMVTITTGLSMRTREKSENLKRLNETLELRVLARIAASEAKSKRLEQQIEVLQLIRRHDTDDAFSALDQVINNLKVLAVEKNDSNFEGLK